MQQIFIELYNYRPAWAKCLEISRHNGKQRSHRVLRIDNF